MPSQVNFDAARILPEKLPATAIGGCSNHFYQHYPLAFEDRERPLVGFHFYSKDSNAPEQSYMCTNEIWNHPSLSFNKTFSKPLP